MKESLTKIFIKLPIGDIIAGITVLLTMTSMLSTILLLIEKPSSFYSASALVLCITGIMILPALFTCLGSYSADKLDKLQNNIKTSIKNKKLKIEYYRNKYPECTDRINSYCYGFLVDNPFYQRGTKICRDCFCPLKFAMMINDNRKEKENKND